MIAPKAFDAFRLRRPQDKTKDVLDARTVKKVRAELEPKLARRGKAVARETLDVAKVEKLHGKRPEEWRAWSFVMIGILTEVKPDYAPDPGARRGRGAMWRSGKHEVSALRAKKRATSCGCAPSPRRGA